MPGSSLHYLSLIYYFPILRLGKSKQKKREEKREQIIARLEE